MRLITEQTNDIQIITEANDSGGKDYHIEGIFMQSETKNRNGRMYPCEILENEVKRYNAEYVKDGRAMGELGHPEGPSLNLERVSHLIKELNPNGNNITGKAKIMDTPYGKIVKNLIDEGVKLGVSSRGMGSIKSDKNGVSVVQEDFMLAAVDIVADPSAPDAFVNGIMEGREWVWENGVLTEKEIMQSKNRISLAPKRKLEQVKLQEFKNFLRGL
jgi:hypothetical protein